MDRWRREMWWMGRRCGLNLILRMNYLYHRPFQFSFLFLVSFSFVFLSLSHPDKSEGARPKGAVLQLPVLWYSPHIDGVKPSVVDRSMVIHGRGGGCNEMRPLA